jgi:GTPase
MKPTVVLVGRPNVGKSTLFNRLTRSRDALVADYPGLTRDRHYGQAVYQGQSYIVVDTGGFEPVTDEGIMVEMARQTLQAIDEADVVLFIVDGRDGLCTHDETIANILRRSGRRVLLVVNKCEGLSSDPARAEFYELGLGDPLPISSTHGDRVGDVLELALEPFYPWITEEDEAQNKTPKLAIVGRPNVGKSTLVNTLLGEERVIAFDEPGTTRDSIYLPCLLEGDAWTLIDTAGIRRRGKVTQAIEKFSVIKTLQAIEDANVVVLMLDAKEDVSEQDAHIAAYILQAGKALVVSLNKWERIEPLQQDQLNRDYDRKLNFLEFAERIKMSAKSGKGTAELLKAVKRAYTSAMIDLSTPKLTRALQLAIEQQQPPRQGVVRPKLRYAHQGGNNPPVVVIHGNALGKIPLSYQRYLERFFRQSFKLQGTPLRVQFKSSVNPYVHN